MKFPDHKKQLCPKAMFYFVFVFLFNNLLFIIIIIIITRFFNYVCMY